MDPLTQRLWLRSGLNHAHPLLPPVHNVRVVHLREELTEADIDLHNARVALEKLEAAGPGGDTSDLYTAMWKLQKREQHYFASRYLRSDKAVLRGWKAFPKYQVDLGDRVGRGYQAGVYGVVNHPDKVAKRSRITNEQRLKSVVEMSKLGEFASDKGFGPKVFENSYDNRVVHYDEERLDFAEGVLWTTVMEKIQVLNTQEEVDREYIGIIETLKKMRRHKFLNVDGFFGQSSLSKTIVSVDFGAVEFPKDDTEYIVCLADYLDGSADFTPNYQLPARKYAEKFPEDDFTKAILIPVIKKLDNNGT